MRRRDTELRSHKAMMAALERLGDEQWLALEAEVRKVLARHPRLVGFVQAVGWGTSFKDRRGEMLSAEWDDLPAAARRVLRMDEDYVSIFGARNVWVLPGEPVVEIAEIKRKRRTP